MTFNFSSDLACYSLKNNNNVPTSLVDLNNHYTLRQQQLPTAMTTKDVQNDAQQPISSSVSSTSISSSTKTHSKLDLLIETATSFHLDSFITATASSTPTVSSSPTSSSTPNKRKLSSSLEFLCDHAEKELSASNLKNESIVSISPTVKKPVKKYAKKQRKQNLLQLQNKQEPSISRQGSSSNIITPTTELSNPLAIKLASPSTHTKRQRSGPSCDCCRSRKIKCDSEIFILSTLESINNKENNLDAPNSHIAHCAFISSNPKSGYQYYKIVKDEEHALNNKFTSFNYLQFKPCSACITKNLKCCFSKGFTRNDIIKFNKSEKLSSNNSSSTELNSSLPSPSPSLTSNIPISPPSTTPSSSSEIKIEPSEEVENAVTANTCNNSNTDNNTHNVAKQLPTPSPTPAIINSELADNTSAIKDFKKSSKKTSCKTCRFKKIKCVKIENSDLCAYCNKKGIGCLFE